MSDLSPELRELVLAGKGATLPTAADSARIFELLRTRLGEAAFASAETGQAVAASSSAGVVTGKLATLGIAGLALLGGFLFFSARNHRAAPSDSNSAPRAAATELAPQAAPLLPQAPSSTTAEAAATPGSNDGVRTEPRPSASHHPKDSLSEEVAILSRAETALHSGQPDVALKLLNEHERRFGNGLLAEERIAARIQALCALGRTADANAQLAHLSPKSLHGEQASQACGPRRAN